MKQSLKYITIIMAAMAAILLVGCSEINIDASISNENFVSYTYTLYFSDLDKYEMNEQSLRSVLQDINSYWRKKDFDSKIIYGIDEITLVCKMEKQCENRKEAFEVLYEFMTNDITVFDHVDYTYTQDFYKENYSMVAHLDLTEMIDEEIYEIYPQIVGENIDEFIQSAKCTVTITLPSNESTEEDTLIQNKVVTQVDFSKSADISISGTINNNINVRYENNLMEKKSNTTKALIIFGTLLVVIIILLILLLIFKKKIVKSYKNSKKMNETENQKE